MSQHQPTPHTADQAGVIQQSKNFTARAGRWSASHRQTAVLGWLAFVFVAFALGNATGTVTLKSQDAGNGESRAASQILAHQFPRARAGELVLIQSRGARLGGAEHRAAVADLVARLAQIRAVTDVKSPLAAGNAGQVSKDGHSALLSFQITGDPDTANSRVGSALTATSAVQVAHPQLTIGEFGDASANQAVSQRISADFRKAEVTSLPVTLVILALAFGALIAAGIPLLLGITAVVAALGLTALFSHVTGVDPAINSVILVIGLAVGVDYFAVLSAPGARGAGAGAEPSRCAGDRCGHVGPGRTGVWIDGDRGDVRHVPYGVAHLLVLRCRHGAGGRDLDRWLADRAAGRALQAGR